MPDSAAGWSGFPSSALPSAESGQPLLASVCSASSGAGEEPIVHARAMQLIPGYFSGVGDLFSALVLAHYEPSVPSTSASSALNLDKQTPLSRAVSRALAKTHAVLTRTHQYFEGLPEDERNNSDEELDSKDPERKVVRMRARELRLVQSMDVITDQRLGEEGMVLWELR
jgi:pyridoxine kinase